MILPTLSQSFFRGVSVPSDAFILSFFDQDLGIGYTAHIKTAHGSDVGTTPGYFEVKQVLTKFSYMTVSLGVYDLPVWSVRALCFANGAPGMSNI
jgi:hypothetical protein